MTDTSGQPVTRNNLRDSSYLQPMRSSPISPPFPNLRDSPETGLAIVHNLLDSDENDNSLLEVDIQDASHVESLEWDPSFQHLEMTSPCIDDQYQSVQINPTWTQVRLLFSSTPNQRRNRVSQLRRSLPLERESRGPTLPLFLRRFNPFKKRDI